MPNLFQPTYTERDYAILRSLYESRVMTRAHLCSIHFDGHARMTKKRLQKLAADGLVGARPRRPGEPGVHVLTKHGYELLRQEGITAQYPTLGPNHLRKRFDVSPLTLAHELAVMDVKAAFYRGSAPAHEGSPRPHVEEFTTWPLLFRFRTTSADGRRAWNYPDARIRLRFPGTGSPETAFYLELDRSTESLPVLLDKAEAYQHHSREKTLPFRVLWVFRTPLRRDHVAASFRNLRPPVLTQAWLTTIDELTADPFGHIWLLPRDAGSSNPVRCSLMPSA